MMFPARQVPPAISTFLCKRWPPRAPRKWPARFRFQCRTIRGRKNPCRPVAPPPLCVEKNTRMEHSPGKLTATKKNHPAGKAKLQRIRKPSLQPRWFRKLRPPSCRCPCFCPPRSSSQRQAARTPRLSQLRLRPKIPAFRKLFPQPPARRNRRKPAPPATRFPRRFSGSRTWRRNFFPRLQAKNFVKMAHRHWKPQRNRPLIRRRRWRPRWRTLQTSQRRASRQAQPRNPRRAIQSPNRTKPLFLKQWKPPHTRHWMPVRLFRMKRLRRIVAWELQVHPCR